MKECTDKEWQHCQEEKRGCFGCDYDKESLPEARMQALEFLANIGGRTLK